METKLESSRGDLIADDYNTLVRRFNRLFVLEERIDKHIQQAEKARALKEQYAKEVLITGRSIDFQERSKNCGLKSKRDESCKTEGHFCETQVPGWPQLFSAVR